MFACYNFPRYLVAFVYGNITHATKLQEEIAYLNEKAEKDFLKNISEANSSLSMTRNKIEEIIMNGRHKKRQPYKKDLFT